MRFPSAGKTGFYSNPNRFLPQGELRQDSYAEINTKGQMGSVSENEILIIFVPTSDICDYPCEEIVVERGADVDTTRPQRRSRRLAFPGRLR